MTTTYRKIRKSGSNPAKVADAWSGYNWNTTSNTGATVSDDTALSLTTFYAGVSLIASSIGGLPIHVYEETEKEPLKLKTENTAYLWRRPNPEMTKQTFWERVAGDEVRGNAFIWVEKTDFGGVLALWYVDRRRMRVGRATSGIKVYELDNEDAMIDYKGGGEIVHIPNWGDALVGYDIVKLAAQAIALGLSAEEFAARTFGQGDSPPGILSTDNELSPTEADELEKRWNRRRGGGKNWGKTAVLGRGVKYQQVSQDPEKMQMEQLRKFQQGDMATLLGIPPHMLGLVDRTTSWGSGIAEMGQGFVTYTLNRHVGRIKQAIDDALLVRELTDRYVVFDPGGLLRGSITQQYEAHDKGIKGSFLTQNEARKDLELDTKPEGDDLLIPLNMGTVRDREISRMKIQAEAAGALIRAGFSPSAVIEAMGLPPIEHLGLLPVTLQKPVDESGEALQKPVDESGEALTEEELA